MKEAFIKAISYYLPEKVVTNEDLVKDFPEWTVEKIAEKIGVSSRHIAAENETAGDLAVEAAELLFSERKVKKEDIDFIILCTQSPDYYLPTTACIIQDRLSLSTSCGAFDINLGCSGYEYGLAIAKGFVATGIASNVLLLTAETYSKYLHPKDKGNKTIFGDGASATVVSDNGFARIGKFSLGTDGSGAESLIVKTGGARTRDMAHDESFDENGNPLCSDNLFMDGKAIFDFTADAVPKMVNDVLSKNNILMDDLDLIVFHQANKFMINYLRKLLRIDKDRFYVFMDTVGNTVSSTVPIALCEAQKDGKLKGKILLAGFGVGLSWGACVIDIIQ